MGGAPYSFEIEIPRRYFDVGLSASSGQMFRWKQTANSEWVGANGKHWFRVRVLDGREAYRVESSGPPTVFQSLFRLDWDAADVTETLTRLGPELEPYLQAMPGLRLTRSGDAVETFFSFLCSANNHISRITGMVNHLAAYGPRLEVVDVIDLHRFPRVATLAKVEEAELREKGFGYRAATITQIARELESRGGEAYLRSLGAMPYERAQIELLGFKGIGRKLADCIALFGLDHTEAVPIDTHIWQAATRLYFPHWQGTALTDRKYEEASAFIRNRFGRLAGWAQQALFYENVVNWRTRK
ncbi:DNA glycosylase [Fimbriimonas ginsengisoli]|uniref:DNA-(apurinic or apyrimidinic site) lyase n=1 Tax=Fimbriimonas ginsengisoli Gsoil 348 TaxID=661478 RepID=A0A068NTI2_FIMGI|nr:DNA glycosylase [Fimbriimonas ginsengisoli]AIE86863.1 hypothetical protein OP10G_3495 [Fimbriimonas ginsengisoli Gsoil 348]